MAIPSIDPKVMQQVLGGTKDQLNQIASAYEAVRLNLEEIRQNQNDMSLALMTIYDALKVISLKLGGAPLPTPRISMEVEQDKEDD